MRGGESSFLRFKFSSAWREALASRDHSCSLLKDWVGMVDGLGGKSAIDWLLEERGRPRQMRTRNVFPFGDRGSFLSESLQKWPDGNPPPPLCANRACFQNPCGVLRTAREKGWGVFWVKETKMNRNKTLFSYVREGFPAVFSKIISFPSNALEKGCQFLSRENPRKNLLFLSSFFPQQMKDTPSHTFHEMKDTQPWGIRVAQENSRPSQHHYGGDQDST